MRLYKLMVLIFAERCDRPVGITQSAQMVWLDAYDAPSVRLPSDKQTLFAQFFDPAFPVAFRPCFGRVGTISSQIALFKDCDGGGVGHFRQNSLNFSLLQGICA
jgi:hypothetical protein